MARGSGEAFRDQRGRRGIGSVGYPKEERLMEAIIVMFLLVYVVSLDNRR